MKKEEKNNHPNLEQMEMYIEAKRAAARHKAGDREGVGKEVKGLVKKIAGSMGESGLPLLKYLQENGEEGNVHLINCYSKQYEQARQGSSVGDLFEVYGEQLKGVIGDERYAVAEKSFGEYADTTYGDLREKVEATKAKLENLRTQGKTEETKKLEKKLEGMQIISTAIEGLETLRILDPTKQVKTQLISLFEPEQETEAA